MNHVNLIPKTDFSPDDQLEVACLISVGSSCRCLELLKMAFEAFIREREKVKSLKAWIEVLERQKKYH